MRAAIVVGVVTGVFLVPSFLTWPAAAQNRPALPAPLDIVVAVQSTLERHPLLAVQRQRVAISQAVRQQRSGAFDTLVEGGATEQRTNTALTEAERMGALAAGVPVSALTENTFGVSGSAQRLLRSGIALGPSVVVNRATDNFQTLEGVNRTRVSFDVTVPLLRGKGAAIVAGPETAAGIDVDASWLDLGQQAADLVLDTASRYWQYVASGRQLEIVTQSEARGRTYVEAVTTLVDADRLPRSEINQAQANFDSRAAGRFALEQQVIEARSGLALAMGLPPDEIAGLPSPVDAFPDGLSEAPPSIAPDRVQALIELALARRADYLAAEKRRAAADVLRQVAGNRVRPQLDLTLSTGYSSLRAGRSPGAFLGAPFTQAAGPDAVVGMRWVRPLANIAAQGERAEFEAAYQQALWLRAERARVIATEVVNAVTALTNGTLRLTRATGAVRGFQAALDGEQDKLRLGVGSLTDLLTVEGRLTEALLDLVAAQQAYALGVVQLRYASGTLVDGAVLTPPAREVFFRPLSPAGGRP
ncbi:MAG: TolC family protein [Acidobacteria bacterium]|nr:TolC family protein [Acidobacteriota bacterium]